MQTFGLAKLPGSKGAAAAVLLLGLTLGACASPKLAALGLGSSEPKDAKAQVSPAKPVAADPLADIESTIGQAQALRKAGDLQGAARTLSQLLLFVPDNPRLLGEYGKTLVAQGRSDDALAFLERAVQLQPGDWSFHSAQGVAYDQQARYQAAQASYARALSLKPGEPAVLNNAALSHMQSGDLDGAEKLLLQAGVGPAAGIGPAAGTGTADFPRIAQNLALVQGLKAARAKDAPAQAVAAPVIAAAPPPTPAPPPNAMPDPQIVAAQIVRAPPPPPAPPPPAPPAPIAAVQTESLPVAQAVPPDPKPALARSAAAPKPAAIAKPPVPRAANTSIKPAYYVQAGAYGSPERAGRMARDLDRLGARVSPATVDGRAIYRVRIGPFLDVAQASTAISHAKQMGHADLKIVPE